MFPTGQLKPMSNISSITSNSCASSRAQSKYNCRFLLSQEETYFAKLFFSSGAISEQAFRSKTRTMAQIDAFLLFTVPLCSRRLLPVRAIKMFAALCWTLSEPYQFPYYLPARSWMFEYPRWESPAARFPNFVWFETVSVPAGRPHYSLPSTYHISYHISLHSLDWTR